MTVVQAVVLTTCVLRNTSMTVVQAIVLTTCVLRNTSMTVVQAVVLTEAEEIMNRSHKCCKLTDGY